MLPPLYPLSLFLPLRSASWGSITTFCILRCAPAGTGACATPRWSFDCWVSQRQKLNNLIPTQGGSVCVCGVLPCVLRTWCVAWDLAFCFAYFNEFYDSASDYDAHKQSGLGMRMPGSIPGRIPGRISFNHVFLLIAA